MGNVTLNAGQLWKVRFACAVVLALLAVGLWANLPYLAAEHHRLEPWKIAGLWTGDVTALLWFARFAFIHAVLGRPLVPALASDVRGRFRFVLWSGVAALVVDLTMTLYLMHDERAGYARGHVTTAQVSAIQVHKRPEATGYDVDCHFRDESGAGHAAHVRVLAHRHEFPAGLPGAAIAVLSSSGTGAKAIPIRYDPSLPERAWIDGLGWQDENGLYWFSLGALALQAGLTALFLLLLATPRRSTAGSLPWWWDAYKALPLAVESFLMLGMGLIDRFMDWLSP
jgi:hypothetical protein